MDRSLLTYYLGLSALGGLLASPVFPEYAPFVIVPLIQCLIVVRMLRHKKNRRLFLVLSAVCLTTGCVLHFMPQSNSGGVSELGVFLALVAFIPCLRYLMAIRKDESVASVVASGDI